MKQKVRRGMAPFGPIALPEPPPPEAPPSHVSRRRDQRPSNSRANELAMLGAADRMVSNINSQRIAAMRDRYLTQDQMTRDIVLKRLAGRAAVPQTYGIAQDYEQDFEAQRQNEIFYVRQLMQAYAGDESLTRQLQSYLTDLERHRPAVSVRGHDPAKYR